VVVLSMVWSGMEKVCMMLCIDDSILLLSLHAASLPAGVLHGSNGHALVGPPDPQTKPESKKILDTTRVDLIGPVGGAAVALVLGLWAASEAPPVRQVLSLLSLTEANNAFTQYYRGQCGRNDTDVLFNEG